jgi:two-component sensor histidine kinase
LDEGGVVMGVLGVGRDITDRVTMDIELRQSKTRLQEAHRLAQLGNWELDLTSNRLICSDEIFRIFEIDKMQFRASYEAFLSAVHPDDRAMVNEAYTTSVREHTPYEIVHRLLMADGRVKYVQERCETDYDQNGRPIRSHGTLQDVTERRLAELRIETALREKETLLREVHHRVKNNLQIISSLLYFQSKKIRDVEDLAAFREGQDRLKSMILVHEKLYRSENLAHIDFADYVRALADGVRQSYAPIRAKIDLVIDVPSLALPLEIAMPTGMILNELLTNSFKYAFPGGHGGMVRICVIPAEEAIEILVEDTGVGFPEGIDPERPATFGLQLIHGLMSQLGGRIVFRRERGQGTSVQVQVPISVPAGP